MSKIYFFFSGTRFKNSYFRIPPPFTAPLVAGPPHLRHVLFKPVGARHQRTQDFRKLTTVGQHEITHHRAYHRMQFWITPDLMRHRPKQTISIATHGDDLQLMGGFHLFPKTQGTVLPLLFHLCCFRTVRGQPTRFLGMIYPHVMFLAPTVKGHQYFTAMDRDNSATAPLCHLTFGVPTGESVFDVTFAMHRPTANGGGWRSSWRSRGTTGGRWCTHLAVQGSRASFGRLPRWWWWWWW